MVVHHRVRADFHPGEAGQAPHQAAQRFFFRVSEQALAARSAAHDVIARPFRRAHHNPLVRPFPAACEHPTEACPGRQFYPFQRRQPLWLRHRIRRRCRRYWTDHRCTTRLRLCPSIPIHSLARCYRIQPTASSTSLFHECKQTHHLAVVNYIMQVIMYNAAVGSDIQSTQKPERAMRP